MLVIFRYIVEFLNENGCTNGKQTTVGLSLKCVRIERHSGVKFKDLPERLTSIVVIS
jgi:hypothetical protein